jgi:PKD repeat protein
LNKNKIDKWDALLRFLSGNLTVPEFIFEEIQLAYLEKVKTYVESQANMVQYRDTLNKITNAYNEALNGTADSKKMRVLAISHSQGGLFMNDAYERINFIDKNKYFAGFQVATPAFYDPIHNFGYQTHSKDRVINFVRDKIGALPYNMDTPFFVDNTYFTGLDYLDFVLNHGMSTTYLHDENLKLQVRSTLIETAQKLESNCGVPPVALFTATSRASIQPNPNPMTYDFDGSISTDEDTPVLDPNDTGPVEPPDFDIDPEGFEWFIDGTKLTSKGMKPTFTFQTEGEHTVKLIVTDLVGNKSEAYESKVNVINQAPVADFTYTVQGLKASFNASASTDDGRIVSYRWKIESSNFSTTLPSASRTYPVGGTYYVELIAVDNNGKVSAPVRKSLTVGILGCRDETSGVSYPGRLHTNPDGSPGGFIAEGSVATSDVTISSDSQVCGISTIEGKVNITSNSRVVNSTLKATIARPETGDGIYIYNSTIKESNLDGGLITTISSSVINGQISGFFHQILSSSVYSSIIKGNYTSITSGSILNNAAIENQSVNTTTFLTILASNINSSILALDIGTDQIPSGKSGTIVVQYSTVNAPITGYDILIFRATTNSLIFGFDITRAFSVFP